MALGAYYYSRSGLVASRQLKMEGDTRLQQCSHFSCHGGFTLIEIAVALLILGLLFGMVSVPLLAQRDMEQRRTTQRALDEALAALSGHAVTRGYLPCPAQSTTGGVEDRPADNAQCNTQQGLLPWATLGLPPSASQDGWGHLLGYAVSSLHSNPALLFGLGNKGRITILTRDSSGTLVKLSNADGIPAVVFSHGKNGYWASVLDGANITSLPDSTAPNEDEDVNAGQAALSRGNSTWNESGPYDRAGRVFIYRTAAVAGSSGGEFDDMVSWLSPYILFIQMVNAGQLPRLP